MGAAVAAYREGNNAGRGFALPEDEIDEAVAALEADGWELLMARHTPDEVAVLRCLLVPERRVLIGGDAMGRSAWAVEVRS
jgi:hypothetical protein